MITIIQQAKWILLYSSEQVADIDESGKPYLEHRKKEDGIIQPAIIEADGLRLFSAVPSSAAEAARINQQVEQFACHVKRLESGEYPS